ncbi:MAG: hypothetical protein HYS56_03790 [Candidatus Omnitrophica bacterium]|nr:hypothetical protein [Candidatus Omnitrophota bacterium]
MTKSFAYVKRVPSLRTVLDVVFTAQTVLDTNRRNQFWPAWDSLNLRTETTSKAGFLILSVWAVCEKTSADSSPEPTQGWIQIRQAGQTDWAWQRTVGQIYDSVDGLEQPYHNIYMDGAHAPYFFICPVNESQQIEYRYHFWSTTTGNFRYEFKISILGYFEFDGTLLN